MKQLSIMASKGKSGFSPHAAKGPKGLFSAIGGLLLDFKKYTFLGTAILAIVLNVVSIYSLINVINRYIGEKEFNKLSVYTDISYLLKEAESILMHGSRSTSVSNIYDILTMPKEKKITTHQFVTLIGNTIAIDFLFVAPAFLLMSYAISLSKMNRPFPINRCFIFPSSLIAIISIVLQRFATKKKVGEWIMGNLRIEGLELIHYTERDNIDVEKSISNHSTICIITLIFTSLFYLIASYRLPITLGLPIFIAFANLCLALHKFIFDFHYIYNRIMHDSKARVIIFDRDFISEANDGQRIPELAKKVTKLSQIHIIGKADEFIDEFKKRLSVLIKLHATVINRYGIDSSCIKILDTYITLLGHEIPYLDNNSEFQKQLSVLIKLHETVINRYGIDSSCIKILSMYIVTLQYAIQYLNTLIDSKKDAKISVKISRTNDGMVRALKNDLEKMKSPNFQSRRMDLGKSKKAHADLVNMLTDRDNAPNQITYKTTCDGSAACIMEGETSIYKFEGSDNPKVSNQYIHFGRCASFPSFKSLLDDPALDNWNVQTIKGINNEEKTILLTELIAILMVVKNVEGLLSRDTANESRIMWKNLLNNVAVDLTVEGVDVIDSVDGVDGGARVGQ